MTDRQPAWGEGWGGWVVRVVLAGGIAGLVLAVFSPFVSPLLWAGVLCYALYPLYARLLSATGDRRTVSALAMCLMLMICVIAPLLYLSLLIAEDLTEGYRTFVGSLMEGDQPFLEGWRNYPFLASLAETVQHLERLTGTNVRMSIAGNLAELGKILIEQVTRIATHALYALVQLGIILLCAFYFSETGRPWSTGFARLRRLRPSISGYWVSVSMKSSRERSTGTRPSLCSKA